MTDTAPTTPKPCALCSRGVPVPGTASFLWTDGLFTATTRTTLPGWVNLRLNRHAEGFWSLDDDEAAAFGPALRAVGQAMRAVTSAERIYIYWMGEDNIHFQLHMAPRPPKTPTDRRGEALHAQMMPISRVELWLGAGSEEQTSAVGESMRDELTRLDPLAGRGRV